MEIRLTKHQLSTQTYLPGGREPGLPVLRQDVGSCQSVQTSLLAMQLLVLAVSAI